MSSARLLTHLVTGAAGQDGILLTRRLLAAGHRVVACVAPGAAPSALLDGAEVVEHDVRDTDAFATLLTRTGADVVHNLAALSSVAASWEDPAASQEINQDAVLGMLDVLRGLMATPDARGVTTRIVDGDTAVQRCAFTEPKWIAVTCAKYLPVSVTVLPPAAEPWLGLTAPTTGARR